MKVVLCNKEHPDYGVVTVPLPIPDKEYGHCMDMLDLLEIGDVTAHDCYVDQIIDAPPSLDMLEGTMVNVDEIDFLARSLDRYTYDELAKFQCMTATRDHWDMQSLINLSFCCEQTTVITDFSKLEDVGKSHYLTQNGGCAPKEIFDHLNGKSIARELIAGGEGKVTPYGVVFENAMRLEPRYDGNSFPPYGDQPYRMEFEIESPKDGGVVLFLPQPEKRLERLLERAGIRDLEELKINSWHSDLPETITDRLDVSYESFYELNRLCNVLWKLDNTQMDKLSAAVHFAWPEHAFQIRHLAENLEQFVFIPGVKTAEEYGRYMIRDSGRFEYDEELGEYYDYAKYGLNRFAGECGEFNDMGYISYHGTMSLEELMMENPAEQLQGMEMDMSL